ncbi:MAG: hypothetical protein HY047_04605 [Acidobacteria bacterium]|nr:hypothetical protein [Acidobacteriota bacterium]
MDRALDKAAASADDDVRRDAYNAVQRQVAIDVPYISLWCKTNVVAAQRTLTGIHLLPTADFTFLKNVARTTTDQRAAR